MRINEALHSDRVVTPLSTKITLFICLVLLFGRMVFLQWNVSFFNVAIFICIAYGLITFTIWLNRKELSTLMLDGSSIIIFLAVGFLFSFLIPFPFGVFLALVTLLNFRFISSSKLPIRSVTSLFPPLTIFYIAALMTPYILKILVIGNSLTWPIDKAIADAVFTLNLPLAVLEEIIYRGMLWMLLKKLNIKEYLIIFIQAILFWLSHLSYIVTDPASFWLWLPLGSFLLGLIVLRSKSVTPSIIGHCLYNFFLAIVR